MFKLHYCSIARFTILIAGLIFMGTPALAIHPESNSETDNLKKRIEALEARQQAESAVQEPGLDFGRVNQHLLLHGLIEAESYYAKQEGGNEESDLVLATVELSIEATLNDSVGGHLTLIYEEEADDDIEVDEAVISLYSPRQVFSQKPSLHMGRMYLPFGTFNSYMISDPLTLELGETRDTAAMFALEGDVWGLKMGFFNGDAEPDGDNDNIDSWVAALEVAAGENFGFGGSYISDLAESDNELVQDAALYSSRVAGASAFLSAQCGQFHFEAEYLSALEDFDSSLVTIGEDLTGQRPKAWTLELAWMPTEQLQVAARYEEAKDFQDDVRRYGATASYGLHEHVVVALEYLRADADVDEDDPVDVVTAQLALEF